MFLPRPNPASITSRKFLNVLLKGQSKRFNVGSLALPGTELALLLTRLMHECFTAARASRSYFGVFCRSSTSEPSAPVRTKAPSLFCFVIDFITKVFTTRLAIGEIIFWHLRNLNFLFCRQWPVKAGHRTSSIVQRLEVCHL
jgi:hypothetical protein